MKTQFPDRVREIEAPHIRHQDIQTLDALLRIEELLTKLLDHEDRRQPVIEQKPDPKPVARKNTRQL